MKRQLVLFVLALHQLAAHAQVAKESTNVNFIKSIQFIGIEKQRQLPLVRLGESFTLVFDDLLAQDNDYYYKIKYYNHDWTPSDLFPNQYMKGLDNQRIQDFRSSYGTLQRYTHYNLQLPNTAVDFLVSGNYMVEVYDAEDRLVFSRKFLVYEEMASIELGVYPTQNLTTFRTHQNLQFSIAPLGFRVRNIEKDLRVWMLQNDQWDTAQIAPTPQYNNGNQLVYRYDTLTQFEGGNEFLFFDTKDLRSTNANISYVNKENLYQHYLYTNAVRKDLPYTYAPDINGNFVLQTLQGSDPMIEADYSIIYFSLAKQYQLNEEEVYVYGKFNNYALEEENKLIYNPSLEIYEGFLLLKQGFYNYKFVTKKGEQLYKNSVSGSHAQTENSYTLMVYHRFQGQRYDRLIGQGYTQSLSLQK